MAAEAQETVIRVPPTLFGPMRFAARFIPVLLMLATSLAVVDSRAASGWLNWRGPNQDGISKDKLHPSLKGYQIWADGLKPLFTEILGPPAKTDHAPPPTGDPSANLPRNK